MFGNSVSGAARIISSENLSILNESNDVKLLTENLSSLNNTNDVKMTISSDLQADATAIINDNEVIDTSKIETRWAKDARIYEYGSAANPDMKPIAVVDHPSTLHENGSTRIIPFDNSEMLDIDSPCTSPNLMASFIRVNTGENIRTHVPNATSQAFYVIRGSGTTQIIDAVENGNSDERHECITWSTGDMFCVPVTRTEMIHTCIAAESHDGAAIYWIHDEPLMTYLGVTANVKKFNPTLYKKSDMLAHVDEIRHKTGDCHKKNRLGVLLGNAKCRQTKTLTHVLWSLLNSIPGNTVQRPHRHNSVALDLCVSAKPGVYTLMGKEIDSDGLIIDPIRCEWTAGSVFVTPPGWWHSHHNGSDDVAWVLPIQDAGLYTHQRTLDIRFVDDELKLHKAGRIRGSAFNITNKAYLLMSERTKCIDETKEVDSVVTTQKRTASDALGLKRKIMKTL